MSKRGEQTKKDHEQKITKLAKDFFSIDKNNDSLSKKRKTLKSKLWVELYEYYKEVYLSKFDEYIDVINDTILNCCEKYNSELKNPFLHYINAAIKKNRL